MEILRGLAQGAVENDQELFCAHEVGNPQILFFMASGIEKDDARRPEQAEVFEQGFVLIA
jgi:hypothetical protein